MTTTLVRRLFSSQELHLGISDREYGLLPDGEPGAHA